MTVASKRMGPKKSETWHMLLDVAERIIREEGVAAASSRRIGEEAGVAQQLVYYYFKNMDEVLLATFKRQAETALDRAETMLEKVKENPAQNVMSQFWLELGSTIEAKFNFEFMTLCNRNDMYRKEMATFLTRWRQLQSEAIALEWKGKALDFGDLSPSAAAFMIYSTRLVLIREEMMGITEGHREAEAAVQWFLDRPDPGMSTPD